MSAQLLGPRCPVHGLVFVNQCAGCGAARNNRSDICWHKNVWMLCELCEGEMLRKVHEGTAVSRGESL